MPQTLLSDWCHLHLEDGRFSNIIGVVISALNLTIFTPYSYQETRLIKPWYSVVLEALRGRSAQFVRFWIHFFFLFLRQTTDGGGWTVFQKRLDGSVNFFREWNEYKEGFGSAGGEYWLGLENIHRLTHQGRMVLRVDLIGKQLQSAYALYKDFVVSDEKLNYTLGLGSYTGWSLF